MEFTKNRHRESTQDALTTTLLINSNNPTLVATWDLNKPSQSESSKVIRLRRGFESLGPNGDHRIKVTEPDFAPGGKYGAICKLFMSYSNRPKEEYVATGWLIEKDLIATAGHCVYDEGGLLRYIKVYFGYSGPESVTMTTCTYRYGNAVAAPAEYLKAQAYAHDVGFVRLNQPIDNIEPVLYSDTPLKANARLGVVGYPQERDFGHYMYEHWEDVPIDLAKTEMLLNYKIDTTGGQSGSPVFTNDQTAVGVHVAGGYPNYGSVIGPAGNVFDEYLLAFRVKDGYLSDSATVVPITSGKIMAKGFQMIRIGNNTKISDQQLDHTPHPKGMPATEAASAVSSSDDSSASDSEDDDDDDNNEDDHGDDKSRSSVEPIEQTVDKTPVKSVEKTISKLFGGSSRKPAHKPSRSGMRVLVGVVLRFPERLLLTEADGAAPPPTVTDIKAATQKALDQPDVQTTFFVNFPPNFGGAAQKQLRKLVDSVQSWQAWSSSICEGKVQEQINAKQLSSASDGQFARSTYRSKVFDYLFRQASWFSKSFDQNMTQKISCQKVDFHTEILKAVLSGFTVPATVFSQLEAILTKIGDTISLGKQTNNEKQQYWIMFTRYDYQQVTDTVQPVLRVINFSVDQNMATYTSNKVNYTSINIDIQFGQYQADFISRTYKKVQAGIDNSLVEAGMKLVQQKTFDIPVDK